ncbi:MAG: (2Fe-2S)-binding protein [Pseudomonadota bacterium]
MYVCICNALTESAVRKAARSSPCKNAKSAYQTLGVKPDCGSCLKRAAGIIREEQGRIGVPA